MFLNVAQTLEVALRLTRDGISHRRSNKEQSTMKRSSLALVAVTLLAAVALSLHSPGQTQNQAPSPARSRSDEMLDRWNDIGNKLVAMARIFPKTNTTSRCRRTSAPSPRIFSTQPPWISY